MSVCQHRDCTREARAAVKTARPTRENVWTRVWWDDRVEPVPRSAERLCKQHLTETLVGLANVLTDNDEPEPEPDPVPTPHPLDCWCGGTGERPETGGPCNMN
jgi:hypothetical protein